MKFDITGIIFGNDVRVETMKTQFIGSSDNVDKLSNVMFLSDSDSRLMVATQRYAGSGYPIKWEEVALVKHLPEHIYTNEIVYGFYVGGHYPYAYHYPYHYKYRYDYSYKYRYL